MTTRCDFYIGRGQTATYLGSIGQGADLTRLVDCFAGVTSAKAFTDRLQALFEELGEISPRYGWPWAWRTSHETGLVIAYDLGSCWTPHPSGYWARLPSYKRATGDLCQFPDMLAPMEATADGRLRLQLRHEADVVTSVEQPVLSQLLVLVVRQLLANWIHAYRDNTGFWAPVIEQTPGTVPDLVAIALILKESVDYTELLSELDPHDINTTRLRKLLDWLIENGGDVKVDVQDKVLDSHQPYLFGLPLPPHELAAPGEEPEIAAFDHVRDTEGFAEMQALCFALVEDNPSLYAALILREATYFGLVPAPEPVPIVNFVVEPQAGLAGESVLELSSTAAGRLRIRQFLNELVFPAP